MMNRKGFTLIELLIVVVIIGILAAIAIPKFANTKVKAYTAAMKSDLRNLVTAEEAYFADSAHYTSLIGTGTSFGPARRGTRPKTSWANFIMLRGISPNRSDWPVTMNTSRISDTSRT